MTYHDLTVKMGESGRVRLKWPGIAVEVRGCYIMRRRKRLPSYRLHKPTGQAVVTLNGKDYYLGRHGTQMSKDAYDRLTAEWLADGRQLPAARRSMADPAVPEEIELEPRTRPAHRSGGPTINELILAWMPIQKKKVGARQLVRNHEPVLALPQDPWPGRRYASPESSVIYNPEGKISQEKLENPAGFWNNVEENTFSLFQNKGAFE